MRARLMQWGGRVKTSHTMTRIEKRPSLQPQFFEGLPCLNLDAGCSEGRFDYGSECSITELTPWMCSVARDVHLLLDGNVERASVTAMTLTAPRRARADSRTSAHRHRVRCCPPAAAIVGSGSRPDSLIMLVTAATTKVVRIAAEQDGGPDLSQMEPAVGLVRTGWSVQGRRIVGPFNDLRCS
jgi:hypothetical protein